MTCAICGDELAGRHHVLELYATRAPFEPARWSVCSTHVPGLQFVMPRILSAANTPEESTPDA